MDSLKGETLNGTKLFNRTDGDMTVSNVTLTNLDYDSALQDGGQNLGDSTDASVTLDTISDDNLSNIMDNVTGLVTEAAGDESTLGFASDHLSNMSMNRSLPIAVSWMSILRKRLQTTHRLACNTRQQQRQLFSQTSVRQRCSTY